MATVKVWNDNAHPYQEEFREKLIKIPAKGFVEMEAGEALLFKGSFAPIKVDADGNPIPEGFKMIRIEEISDQADETEAVRTELICQACRYEASNAKDLSEHIEADHKDAQVRDEEAEREIARRKKARAS